jgi:hypothetical protein
MAKPSGVVTAVTLGILRVLNGQYLPLTEVSDEYRPKRRTAKGLVYPLAKERTARTSPPTFLFLDSLVKERGCYKSEFAAAYFTDIRGCHNLIDHSVFTSYQVRVNCTDRASFALSSSAQVLI